MITVTRISAGLYSVSAGDPDRTVTVIRYNRRDGDGWTGWMARAEWDRFLYTDPLWTKAAAVREAEAMLALEYN